MPNMGMLIGSAGSGKTTELLRLMEEVCTRGDYGPNQIGFVSFTRAARAENCEPIVACPWCGWCSHPSTTGGVCDVCRRVHRPPVNEMIRELREAGLDAWDNVDIEETLGR